MKDIFEVKRSKMFYEDNGCRCDAIGDVLSFRGIATSHGYKNEAIIGFYDYNTDSYYWFYEELEDNELYLNKISNLNSDATLDEFEDAMNNSVDVETTFKLTQVAHDYSLIFGRRNN